MRNNEKGFTLLEMAMTLIIVGIIGLSVTGALTRIVQDFVAARAVAERMPVIDAALSVIRRGLEQEDQIGQEEFIRTEAGHLQMKADGRWVNLLKGAWIKEALKETKYELNKSQAGIQEIRRLKLADDDSAMPVFSRPVWWDVTVTVSISNELPSLDFPISVGK